MRKSLLVVAATAAVVTAAMPARPAEAGCRNCAAGYPAYYVYDGVAAPTYYYGGFYTPRFVFAPRMDQLSYTPYGFNLPYQTMRRAW